MTHWRDPYRHIEVPTTRADRAFRNAWLSLTISLLLGAVALFAWAAAARGQDMHGNGMALPLVGSFAPCPADRPIRKTVDSGFSSCTLVACVGRLVCPAEPSALHPGADCYRMPSADCNTCTRSVTQICLSQEELDAAK